MRASRIVKTRPRLPRPRVSISSLIAGLALSFLGAGQALAGPAPLDEGPGAAPAGGQNPVAPVTDSGFDFSPWLVTAGVLALIIIAASVVAATMRHSHSPAHA